MRGIGLFEVEPISNSVHRRVVDDEESIRAVFAQLLQREGYEVATAEDGFDALLKLRQFLPDVIIIRPQHAQNVGI